MLARLRYVCHYPITRRPACAWFYSQFFVTLLLAVLLRIVALGGDVRFHPDEAFFATFARQAAVHGDWLLPGPLDKSPLSIYSAALSLHFFAARTIPSGVIDVPLRAGEFAARLPNVFAGLLLVALVTALARRVSGERAALLAGLLVALSPYALVFSAAAFTDMLLVTLATAALWLATRDRPAASGAFLALAVAAKQQAILLLPLVLGLLWASHRLDRVRLLRFGVALALGIGGLLLWDALRPDASIFALAAANNRPDGALAAPADWLSRLAHWSRYGGWLLGPPPLTAALLLIGGWATWRTPSRLDGVLWACLWAFALGYLALHVTISFNLYDRYLLPLLPPLALIAGRGLDRLLAVWPTARISRMMGGAALALALAALLITGWQAASWQIDLGRDHFPLDRDGEIVQLAAYLNAKPLGTIIYDHWLGWEMGYYLGAWSDKRRVYYPEPSALATDAQLNPDPAPRYLIAPAEAVLEPWLDALTEAGFGLRVDMQLTSFIVVRVEPPPSSHPPTVPDEVLKCGDQVVRQVRLGQVAIGPGIEARPNLVGVGQRRQNHNGQIVKSGLGPHLPQEFQTTYIGQHHVEDDNIRQRAFAQFLRCRRRVEGFDGLHIAPAQQGPHEFLQSRIIVHHQDTRLYI